jgi:tRNA splicing endonuclease
MNIGNSKFDLQNENFEYYFQSQASLMGEAQRELLPKDIGYKIFKKGHIFDSKSSCKLSFLSKMFVLIRALRKKWILIVEDDVNGMSVEEFFKYKELHEKNLKSKDSDDIISRGIFVLGCKELVDTFSKINTINLSPTYNYLIKSKNKLSVPKDQWIIASNYMSRFLVNYEANRKTIALRTKLNMPEFQVMIRLYAGEEVLSNTIWKDLYKYSFNSSKTKIKLAFGSLQNKGYIVKSGSTVATKLKITALGKDVLNEIFEKYIVKF